MPEIIYSGPHRSVTLAGVVCKRGEPVVFPAATANAVLQQQFWARPAPANHNAAKPADRKV
ncbi:MAG: hypothetical protein Q8O56_12855 [Solirubrobacteraceae bacterium]|nr:hypothetical protein [Solirubrobacteraceae bacterium]